MNVAPAAHRMGLAQRERASEISAKANPTIVPANGIPPTKNWPNPMIPPPNGV